MQEWKKELCREQPETLQELGKGTYIQRRNITLTSMAAQADIYEKLIETEKNQLVIMQAIADLYEKENGGV